MIVSFDLDVHLWHVPRRDDTERSDGEVEHLAVVADGDPLARDPTERLVGGADRIGAQDDLVQHLACGQPQPNTPESSIIAVARAPSGETIVSRWPVPVRPSRRATRHAPRHGRLGPARGTRRSGRDPRPRRRPPPPPRPAPRIDSRARLHVALRARRPRHAHHAELPSARTRPRWGALGPDHTTSSRENKHAQAARVTYANDRRPRHDRGVHLPAERPSVRERRSTGSPPGTHHDASGSR